MEKETGASKTLEFNEILASCCVGCLPNLYLHTSHLGDEGVIHLTFNIICLSLESQLCWTIFSKFRVDIGKLPLNLIKNSLWCH